MRLPFYQQAFLDHLERELQKLRVCLNRTEGPPPHPSHEVYLLRDIILKKVRTDFNAARIDPTHKLRAAIESPYIKYLDLIPPPVYRQLRERTHALNGRKLVGKRLDLDWPKGPGPLPKASELLLPDLQANGGALVADMRHPHVLSTIPAQNLHLWRPFIMMCDAYRKRLAQWYERLVRATDTPRKRQRHDKAGDSEQIARLKLAIETLRDITHTVLHVHLDEFVLTGADPRQVMLPGGPGRGFEKQGAWWQLVPPDKLARFTECVDMLETKYGARGRPEFDRWVSYDTDYDGHRGRVASPGAHYAAKARAILRATGRKTEDWAQSLQDMADAAQEVGRRTFEKNRNLSPRAILSDQNAQDHAEWVETNRAIRKEARRMFNDDGTRREERVKAPVPPPQVISQELNQNDLSPGWADVGTEDDRSV